MLLAEMEAVHEALESTTVRKRDREPRGSGKMMTVSRADWDRVDRSDKRDILGYRDSLMRFLDEVDGEMSVAELRDALTHYD